MKTFDKQFSCHIVLSNKHISVGDVFFCFLEAEKYLTKQNITDCSLIYFEDGFFDRVIRNRPNDDGLKSYIQENKDKIIVKNRQEMQEELVVRLKERYKVPKKMIAITGTKGKTSTAWYLSQMASSLKTCGKCGYIGTLGVYLFQNGFVKEKIETDNHLTTPSIDMMYRYLDIFVSSGAEVVAFEASSHAIFQHRLDGINVDVACFTNLSQDHLDYHHTMEEYFEAKLKLFTEHLKANSSVVLNNDDDYSNKIISSLYAKNSQANIKLISSSNATEDVDKCKKHTCDVLRIVDVKQNRRVQDIEFGYCGSVFNFSTDILGEFQAKNLIMAMLAVNAVYPEVAIGELCADMQAIKAPLGRMQRVGESNVFVDYAHAPKPLEECLLLLRKLYSNIIVVFGCGGDRDKKKRPIMFEIAKKLANTVIITSDNPRNEKPIDIINDILCVENNDKKNYLTSDEFVVKEINAIDARYNQLSNSDAGEKSIIVKEDRGEAIAVAIENYKNSDTSSTAVLIAGKGHEDYQIVGNETKHFDDYEEVVKYLKKS